MYNFTTTPQYEIHEAVMKNDPMEFCRQIDANFRDLALRTSTISMAGTGVDDALMLAYFFGMTNR